MLTQTLGKEGFWAASSHQNTSQACGSIKSEFQQSGHHPSVGLSPPLPLASAPSPPPTSTPGCTDPSGHSLGG